MDEAPHVEFESSKMFAVADVMELTGWSIRTIRAKMATRQFPEPINPGSGSPYWKKAEVLVWIERSSSNLTQHDLREIERNREAYEVALADAKVDAEDIVRDQFAPSAPDHADIYEHVQQGLIDAHNSGVIGQDDLRDIEHELICEAEQEFEYKREQFEYEVAENSEQLAHWKARQAIMGG